MLNIEKKYSESFNQTKQKVMDDTEMTTITNMYSFQESEFYHIFLGKNEAKDNLISVVQFDKEKENPIDKIKTSKTIKIFFFFILNSPLLKNNENIIVLNLLLY